VVDTWTYPVREGDVLLLCSDGLTSMVSEDRVAEILTASGSLAAAADALIDAANRAGGRDNVTVVLFRLEDAGADGLTDQQTMVGAQEPVAAPPPGSPPAGKPAGEEQAGGVRAPATAEARPKVKRLSPIPASAGRSRGADGRNGAARTSRRRMPRAVKVLAALFAVVVVLFLVGAGGYLATRQLYFIGTNPQGIVTIYRGLPYSLPAGIRLYETFYTSGVPASQVPADRRGDLLNNPLRSQSDAPSLVMDLELGRISK
jgi:protein phosphatase